jgi:hypothetical protein
MVDAMRSMMSSSIQCKLQYCSATVHDLYDQYAIDLTTPSFSALYQEHNIVKVTDPTLIASTQPMHSIQSLISLHSQTQSYPNPLAYRPPGSHLHTPRATTSHPITQTPCIFGITQPRARPIPAPIHSVRPDTPNGDAEPSKILVLHLCMETTAMLHMSATWTTSLSNCVFPFVRGFF